jgi:hypothetical protein
MSKTDHGKSLRRKEHLDVALREKDLDDLCGSAILSVDCERPTRYLEVDPPLTIGRRPP